MEKVLPFCQKSFETAFYRHFFFGKTKNAFCHFANRQKFLPKFCGEKKTPTCGENYLCKGKIKNEVNFGSSRQLV